MAWDIAACGTLHRDDITTPHGRVTSLGGSAVYFAIAAALHSRVLLNGIAGEDSIDGYRAMFSGMNADLRGVVVSATPTFVWHAAHDFERWVTASESAEPGCDPELRLRLDAASRAAPVLFVGSMHPRLQLDALAQSRAQLIAADSMTVFMREDAAAVHAVAEGADVLFLNTEEIELLAGVRGWRPAAASMCGRGRLRAVVVKQGPDGAACVTHAGVHEVPAHPVTRVVDPTGAGDALAGGFLGRCAELGRDDDEVFSEALAEGARCAAAAVSAFGTRDLVALHAAGAVPPPDV